MADGYGVIEKVERADRLDVVFADILHTGKLPNVHQGYVAFPAEWDYDGVIERQVEEAAMEAARSRVA
jgi:hypothetical protein